MMFKALKKISTKAETDKDINDAIILIAKDKLPPSLQKLLHGMENRLAFHRSMLLKQKQFAKRTGNLLAWAIPVMAAILTFLETWIDRHEQHTNLLNPAIPFLPLVGLLLTILTVLNSIYRPIEKNINSSHALIRLHDWEMELFIGLRKYEKDGFKNIDGFLLDMDKKLSKIGEIVADLLIPQDPGTDHEQKGSADENLEVRRRASHIQRRESQF